MEFVNDIKIWAPPELNDAVPLCLCDKVCCGISRSVVQSLILKSPWARGWSPNPPRWLCWQCKNDLIKKNTANWRVSVCVWKWVNVAEQLWVVYKSERAPRKYNPFSIHPCVFFHCRIMLKQLKPICSKLDSGTGPIRQKKNLYNLVQMWIISLIMLYYKSFRLSASFFLVYF